LIYIKKCIAIKNKMPLINLRRTDMKFRYLTTMVATIFFTTAFAAENGEVLFTAKNCGACHKLDVKTVGPTVKSIAAKYAGNKEAIATLEKKVRTGGAGVWGSMPMPHTSASVSDAEIKTLVAWMLAH
jgi:cytochrome c